MVHVTGLFRDKFTMGSIHGYVKIKKETCGGSRPSDKGGGGGGSHPDPEIKRGGPGLKKNFGQFGVKIRGGGPPWASLLDPPLQTTHDI